MKKSLKVLIVMVVVNLVCFYSLPSSFVGASSPSIDKTTSQVLENSFNDAKEGTDLFEFEEYVKDDDGNVVETITTKTKRTIYKNEKNEAVKVVLDQEIKTEDVLGNVDFETRKDVIEFNIDGEIQINDEKLSLEDTTYTFQNDSSQQNNVSPTASGRGYDWLTYYNTLSSNLIHYKTHKEPRNGFLDPPAYGDYYSFNITSPNTNYQSLARSVEANRDAIVASSIKLAAYLGVAALTWASVIGAISGVGGAASEAITIFNNSSNGKKSMKEAYNIWG